MTAPAPPAKPGPPSGFPLFVGALVVLAPPAIIAWLAAAVLLRLGRVRRWHLAALAAFTVAVTVAAGGLSAALGRHFWLAEHLGASYLRTGVLEASTGLVAAGVARMVPLGVAAGLVAAAVNTGRSRELAVPDPAAAVREQRRQVRLERKARAMAGRLVSNRVSETNTAPLGVSLGGDLPPSWRSGRYVVLPDHAARLPRLAIGQSGAGKTVYVTREVYLAALEGRQVVALDGKGDRSFVEAVTDAYLAAQPDATVHVFPDLPLDGWRGDAAAQVNRMLGCWQWSLESDWYKQQATLALRLACSAPGQPVDCMAELVRRLDPPTLARLWAKQPTEAALVKMLTPDLPSICIRLANLAAAIAGRLDGTVAIGETDLTIVSLPVMANPTDAEDLFRALMADVAHWVAVRKSRTRSALVVCDEFSALSGGREAATHIMERGRSFGVPSILSGQSYASLGRPEEADRIVSAAATIALFASNTPEDLARLAGSVQTAEAVYQVEDGRWNGRASLTSRAKHRVDPNTVRQLAPGQAVLVSGGRAEKLQVIPAPRANNDLALPGRPFAVAGRVPRRIQPRQGPSAPTGSASPSLDPPGPDPARRHRLGPVPQEQPPTDRANQEVEP